MHFLTCSFFQLLDFISTLNSIHSFIYPFFAFSFTYIFLNAYQSCFILVSFLFFFSGLGSRNPVQRHSSSGNAVDFEPGESIAMSRFDKPNEESEEARAEAEELRNSETETDSATVFDETSLHND